MNDQAASVPPASPFAAAAAVLPVAPLWHLGWAVGALAAGAALMAGLGALSASIAVALGIGALPGLLGYFWRPAGPERVALLAAWSAAMAAAVIIGGGANGPLAAWCLVPALAGALIRMPAEGAVLAAVSLAVAVLVQLSGMSPPAPGGPFGVGLAAAAVLTAGGAAAGAMGVLKRRAQDQKGQADAEHAWMSEVMSDLPNLALALDREGRVEAMFGHALPGLDADELYDGLVPAACEDDRTAVRAAICEALDHGTGAAAFRPLAAKDSPMFLSLRRRGEDGMVALIRDRDPRETGADAPAEATATADSGALDEHIAARGAAEARMQVLERRMRAFKRARDEALHALTAARAGQAAAERGRDDALALADSRARFLANMSHELRTPLNAIMGFSDIMRTKMFGELQGKYAEYAELIHESGRHLTDLINDVLDMSKIEARRYTLDKEVFDVRDPVSGALRLMRLQADEHGVQLRGVLPQQPVMVDADRRALKQIVLNLVSNALKFTPARGSVTVTVQPVGEVLELVVADTGVGIAKEDLLRLGRPYEQAGDAGHKAQGTGLGLSLVKAFAGLHGGEMTIESELGEGAAVTVRLPVLHHEAEPEPAEAVDPEAPFAVEPETVAGPDDEPAPAKAAEVEAAPGPEPEPPPMPEAPEAEAPFTAEPEPERVAAEPVEAFTVGADDDAIAVPTEPGPATLDGEDAPRAEMPPHSADVIPLNFPRDYPRA